MAKKNAGDLRWFTPLDHENEVYRITENAGPELRELAKQFPKAVNEALCMLGGHTRKAMRAALESGGIDGTPFARLSDIRSRLRMDRLKRDAFPRRSQTKKFKEGMVQRWMAEPPKKPNPFGRLYSAMRFQKPRNRLFVEIGAVTPSAARFLSAVQEGRRGSKGAFQYTGSQKVTPDMRRAMFAAGIPLAAETKTVEQQKRPFVPVIFKKLSPDFEAYLVRRTREKLAEQGLLLEER